MQDNRKFVLFSGTIFFLLCGGVDWGPWILMRSGGYNGLTQDIVVTRGLTARRKRVSAVHCPARRWEPTITLPRLWIEDRWHHHQPSPVL